MVFDIIMDENVGDKARLSIDREEDPVVIPSNVMGTIL